MSINFNTQHEPVTLYGRTINFKARVINGTTYFVPRHITYDIAGHWKVTLNGKVTLVVAGADLHYSLGVAWKELKRRMSEELPAQRKRPKITQKPRLKRIDTGRVGVLVRIHKDRCCICTLQTLNGKTKRTTIDSRPVDKVTKSWLSDTIALATMVRECYEERAQAGQLRELVTPENMGAHRKVMGLWPKIVTPQQVFAEYERLTGEKIEHGGKINSEPEIIRTWTPPTRKSWLQDILIRLVHRITLWGGKYLEAHGATPDKITVSVQQADRMMKALDRRL